VSHLGRLKDLTQRPYGMKASENTMRRTRRLDAESGRRQTISGQSRSVLIVEDDGDIRQAIAELIEDEGYACRVASDGLEALAALNLERPDLLIADLLMPLMSGIDLLARLREHPSYRDIPVIAMTAANDRMLGVKLDVPVLQKPIDLFLLSKMLARYCPLGGNPSSASVGER
jgi:CheY-like chemotaxis protein